MRELGKLVAGGGVDTGAVWVAGVGGTMPKIPVTAAAMTVATPTTADATTEGVAESLCGLRRAVTPFPPACLAHGLEVLFEVLFKVCHSLACLPKSAQQRVPPSGHSLMSDSPRTERSPTWIAPVPGTAVDETGPRQPTAAGDLTQLIVAGQSHLCCKTVSGRLLVYSAQCQRGRPGRV